MMRPYRPWGLLNWVLDKGPGTKWNFFGCIGTEERSLAAWQYLTRANLLVRTRFLRIAHRPSRFDPVILDRMAKREREFLGNAGKMDDIREHALLEPYSSIVSEVEDFFQGSHESIILDITSLPKRFFFPILRLLLKNHSVKNFIVTYTFPVAYTADKLAENPLEWDHLPLFGGEYVREKPKMMVAGVGFEAFGLQGQIDQGDSGVPVKLFLPFPSPPESYKRGLEMVRKLQKHRSAEVCEVFRTDSKDVSDSFDRLVTLSDRGRHRILLAPFGPKPISMAMCIFASLTNTAVYYTQPMVYNPDYSIGVSVNAGVTEIYGYCLRLEGHDYYQISPNP